MAFSTTAFAVGLDIEGMSFLETSLESAFTGFSHKASTMKWNAFLTKFVALTAT